LVHFLFRFSFTSPFYLCAFFLTSFPFFRFASSFLYFLLNISPVLLTDSSKPWLYRKHNLSTVTHHSLQMFARVCQHFLKQNTTQPRAIIVSSRF
jgi:hypothetical protein